MDACVLVTEAVMKRTFLTAMTLLIAFAAPAAAAPTAPDRTIEDANGVLNDLAGLTLKGIPPALLADAQGVAIIPRVVKAGFVIGGRTGHGVILARDNKGTWADPVFVDLTGASIGLQAGIESADVVLVFKSRKSLDRLLEGKNKITLGADVAVAAGPLGRQAAAGTDAKLEAEIYSYSRARGLFAGVSLDGAGIVTDRDTTAKFQRDFRSGSIRQAEALKTRLTEMSRTSPATVVPAERPTSSTPPAVLGQPTVVPKQMPQRP